MRPITRRSLATWRRGPASLRLLLRLAWRAQLSMSGSGITRIFRKPFTWGRRHAPPGGRNTTAILLGMVVALVLPKPARSDGKTWRRRAGLKRVRLMYRRQSVV